MADQSPELPDVVEAGVAAGLAGVWVSLPAKVLAFDRARQTVDAQPLVRVAYTGESGERRVETLPTILGAPVAYQRTGDRGTVWDIAKDDMVWLMFASCSLDKWLASKPGQVVDPGVDRKSHLADAWALPGAFPAFAPNGVPTAVQPNTTIIYEPHLLRLGGTDADDRVARVSDLQQIITRLTYQATVVLPPGLPGTASQIEAINAILTALSDPTPGLPSWPEGSSRVRVP